MNQSQLLPPPAERHPRILPEEPLNSSLTGPSARTDFLRRNGTSGIGVQNIRDALRPGIYRTRQLKGKCLRGTQKVQNHFNEVASRLHALVQRFELASVKNQLFQERGNVHDRTFSWQTAHKFRPKIQGAQRDFTSHPNSMRNPCGYPKSARRRKYPHSLRGFNGHNTLTGINNLIVIVIVLTEYKTVRIVTTKCGDERTWGTDGI